MSLKKSGHKSEHLNPFGRFLRSIFLVVVLSSFVLSISFLVKFLATTSTDKYITFLYKTTSPVLAKLNIDETKAGQVAGDFAKRISQTDVLDKTDISSRDTSDVSTVSATVVSNETPIVPKVSVLLLADVHSDFPNLEKALEIAKSRNLTTAFFLGDYTELGVMDDLTKAKNIMDKSGIEYYSLPGDHDLWKSVGPANFLEVFSKDYFVTYLGGFKFVGLNNSANYTPIDAKVLAKFKTDVKDADFVLLSQPLYHPTFQKVMGVVNGEDQPEMKTQAADILTLIRNSSVKAIIAGDQHISSNNGDPVKAQLAHIVIGALTNDRNLQTPRFSILKVDKEGNYQVEEVVLK